MKVLHLYPKNDSLIERHVAYLTEGMRQSADVKKADNVGLFRQILKDMEPDIVHVHGCWQYGIARASTSAIKHGARLIITLHGQLEPWIMKQKSLQENIFKTLLWQRSTIEQAYAIITLGKLERANFLKLGWNKRIEKIHNAVIRKSTTFWINRPYLIGTTLPHRLTLIASVVKSKLPTITPTIGIKILSVKLVTILEKAPPMITPTAKSSTLPLAINSLNSAINPFPLPATPLIFSLSMSFASLPILHNQHYFS